MKKSLFHLTNTKIINAFVYDFIILVFLWITPYWLLNNTTPLHLFILPISLQLIIMYIEGNYESYPLWQSYSKTRLAAISLFTFAFIFFASKYLNYLFYQNIFIPERIYFVFVFPVQFIIFYFYRRISNKLGVFIPKTQRVLILGSKEEAKDVLRWFKKFNIDRKEYKIVETRDIPKGEGLKWNTQETFHFKRESSKIYKKNYDIIIVFESQELDSRELRFLLAFSSHNKAAVTFPEFCGLVKDCYPITHISTAWLLQTSTNTWFKLSIYLRIRVYFDIICALILIIVTSPLWLLAIIGIPLTSRGPIFYTQDRVGKAGKIFKIIKFRSMYIDAEKDGPKFSSKNDTRVTLLGNFMRKTRIDELPQLINVLKCEMGLIGPRPEREHFETILKADIPLLQLRNIIRPGVTGLAQTRTDYANDVESYQEKLGYDIYYIKNLSPFLDITILLQTIRTVLLKKGP
jgi:exopolysaccharide biosynthesis polyprenyl glycosylphosphotransferase